MVDGCIDHRGRYASGDGGLAPSYRDVVGALADGQASAELLVDQGHRYGCVEGHPVADDRWCRGLNLVLRGLL